MPSTISILPNLSDKEELKWDLYPVGNQYQNQLPVREEYWEGNQEKAPENYSLRGPT